MASGEDALHVLVRVNLVLEQGRARNQVAAGGSRVDKRKTLAFQIADLGDTGTLLGDDDTEIKRGFFHVVDCGSTFGHAWVNTHGQWIDFHLATGQNVREWPYLHAIYKLATHCFDHCAIAGASLCGHRDPQSTFEIGPERLEGFLCLLGITALKQTYLEFGR